MAKRVSQRQLDVLRREWQKRLRLQDWKITSRFVAPGDRPENMHDAVGYNFINEAAKEGRISILDPELADDGEMERSEDIENTLVHELLHCHLAPFFTEEEPEATLMEQAIELLAGALCELKRENGRK